MPIFLKHLVGAAFLLASALACVAPADAAAPKKPALKVKVIPGEKREPKKLKLGVTPSGKTPKAGGMGFDLWDDMGKLLNGLGDAYMYDEVAEAKIIQLHADKKLNDYDVIVLTSSAGINNEKLKEPLVQFVANGGALYASDWRYDTIAMAFPDMVSKNLQGDGAAQTVEADIVDPALRDSIGSKTISIRFELPEWKTAAFSSPRVETLVQGKYKKYKSKVEATAPVVVKFRIDKGVVLFSSFHMARDLSRAEDQLLKSLVFNLVTAPSDAEIKDRNSKDGFSPIESRVMGTHAKQSVVKEFATAKTGDLRIALGFRSEKVKMRFNIKSPDGLEYTKECDATTILEVAGAAKGSWTWSVTPIDAPENYPFTVVIATKK